ncbi:MAG: hypothetical protein HYR74_08000 [Candidatus Eisenbacteria bacterium]|nr:hypothetical protein [Candidatus Eisenbacteria bacterium]
MTRRTQGAARDAGAAPRARWSAREITILALITLAGAALRAWLMTQNSGLTMDSPLYVRMAEQIRSGQKAIGFAHHGYPALMALIGGLAPSLETAGRLLSWLAGVALIPLAYALARTAASAAWSAFAAVLVALQPTVAVYSGPVMTETTILALTTAALLLLARGKPLGAGVGLGLAYAVRPDALVILPAAACLTRRGVRGALRLLAGFAIVAAPYVGYLSWERGTFTYTPKSVLVRADGGEREWQVGAEARPAPAPPVADRVRDVAARYPAKFVQHGYRLLQAWPWPLMLLSMLGLVARFGPPAAVLIAFFGLPLLGISPDVRFSQVFVPALACFAALGGAWLAARGSRVARAAWAAAIACAAGGLILAWLGRAGVNALRFDDGPMREMRDAGEWLKAHGRPGATVMDRKAYVAYYAGMHHLQLPADDYDTVIDYARRNADYLVLEEYIVETLRPEFKPLTRDPEFQARERRLRMVYGVRHGPLTGVGVLEVVKDTSAAHGSAP